MTLDLTQDEADALLAILEHAGSDLRQQARGASQARAYWVKLADTALTIANRLQAPAPTHFRYMPACGVKWHGISCSLGLGHDGDHENRNVRGELTAAWIR